MFLRLIFRTIREHLGVHLLIPLFVTCGIWSIFELLSAVWVSHSFAWSEISAQFWREFGPAFGHLGLELFSVYVAFFLVVVLSVWKQSNIRWAMVGALEDILLGANRYFAFGIISLREWFEPNTQVYLDTIIRYQMERRIQQLHDPNALGFRHERVLLFQTENDVRAVQASYLDEHYAKSFSAIHDRFQIPLGYLEPEAFREILSEIGTEMPGILLHYPRFARPRWLWKKLKVTGIPRLRPFALIEKETSIHVLLFLKEENTLTVRTLSDPTEVRICKQLVETISAKIYDESLELRNEFKFSRFLRP